tara:strand:- start:1122 stop:1622 length:501 start_codon:yes stop_codon:yes gene_type:complete
MMMRKRAYVAPSETDQVRFCRPESLLLDGVRLWSQNPENYAYIRRRYACELGAAAAERAAKATKMLAHVIGLNARRTFYLCHPGAMTATADERALLALIGAVLHNRRGQGSAIATWLLPPNCHGTVLALAGELGRAFATGGLELAPPRLPSAPKQAIQQMPTVAFG